MYEEFVECRYCKFATALAHSPLEMLCEKRGVVAAGGKCKKFDLDLLSITTNSPSDSSWPRKSM